MNKSKKESKKQKRCEKHHKNEVVASRACGPAHLVPPSGEAFFSLTRRRYSGAPSHLSFLVSIECRNYDMYFDGRGNYDFLCYCMKIPSSIGLGILTADVVPTPRVSSSAPVASALPLADDVSTSDLNLAYIASRCGLRNAVRFS